jgi:GNAT superfamily N-acetyltransferase
VKLSLPALHLVFAPRAADARGLRFGSVLRRLLRLRLSFESHYHFTQDLRSSPPREVTIDNIYCTAVDSSEHPGFPHMLAIAQEQGLDSGWCRDQLGEGARCILAMSNHDGAERVVGMGMVRTQPFWIEEIRHHFAPGPGGCYLYALYVSPGFRGRGIQHSINSARLRTCLALGARYAYTLVVNTNYASLKGHFAHGARLSARIDCVRLGPLHLASVRKLKTSLPTGSFPHDGFPRSASLHVIAGR